MINKINKLSENAFCDVFGNIFENAKWISKDLYVHKPFGNYEDLSVKMLNIFEKTSKGIYAHDVVKYKLPLGFVGRIFGGKIITWQLNKIFDFRKKILNKLFVK